MRLNNLSEINVIKCQLISNCLLGVFTLFQKMNENKSTNSKVKFVRSFLWKKRRLEKIISNLSDLYKLSLGLFCAIFVQNDSTK